MLIWILHHDNSFTHLKVVRPPQILDREHCQLIGHGFSFCVFLYLFVESEI